MRSIIAVCAGIVAITVVVFKPQQETESFVVTVDTTKSQNKIYERPTGWYLNDTVYTKLKNAQVTKNVFLAMLWDNGYGVVPNIYNLAFLIEEIWKYEKHPITSATRTPAKNQSVGGAKRSFHMFSAAVDFYISSQHKRKNFIALILRLRCAGGIIEYPWGVHIDVRHLPRFSKPLYIKTL